MNILSKVPLRVSLFGGGTDMPEYFSKNQGKVLSLAINKFIYVQYRELPNYSKFKYRFIFNKTEELDSPEYSSNPVFKNIFRFKNLKKLGGEYIYQSDLPSRSGVGSSSAFVIAMLNLLAFIKFNKENKSQSLAEDSIFFEQKILAEKVGIQDQIACSFGGFNLIKIFNDGKFKVNNLYSENKSKIDELTSSFLIIHSNKYRYASDIEAAKSFDKIDLSYLSQAAEEGANIIKSKTSNIFEIGRLLKETWKIKKRLSNNTTTTEINDIIDIAIKNGATGGKVIGAGGGGFVLIQISEKKQKKIIDIFKRNIIHKFSCFGDKPIIQKFNV